MKVLFGLVLASIICGISIFPGKNVDAKGGCLFCGQGQVCYATTLKNCQPGPPVCSRTIPKCDSTAAGVASTCGASINDCLDAGCVPEPRCICPAPESPQGP